MIKTSAQRNFFWEFQFKTVFTRLSRAPSSVVTCRRRECLFPILLSLLDLISLYPPKYQFSTPLVLAAGIERDRGESATQPRLPAYPAIASRRCTPQHLPPPLYKFRLRHPRWRQLPPPLPHKRLQCPKYLQPLLWRQLHFTHVPCVAETWPAAEPER